MYYYIKGTLVQKNDNYVRLDTKQDGMCGLHFTFQRFNTLFIATAYC